MDTLEAVDGVEVLILVDNATDNLSSVPSFVETEFAALERRRRGIWVAGGKCMCCAAHGLSCLITVRQGSATRTILFDTGPEDRTFDQNVSRLGADLGPVEAIVLSHGHWDHGGAMLRALQLIRDRNGGHDVPCYLHPDMFRTRAIKRQDGSMRLMEDVPSVSELTAYGATVVNTTEPQLFLEGTAYVSGEIPRVTPFERGLPGQCRKTDDGWEPDELIMDERFVAVNVAGKGLVVFTACSHAGVINVLTHTKSCFPDLPLHAVLGGLHLVEQNERIIPETVEALQAFDIAVIAAGHCTGWRAVTALANAFGDDKLVPLSVGKQFSF
ncbi:MULTISPECIES: MBL fold metallo-hydrolase [unclassified Mesorhizobium]|uniref:MBL fold metallo-hydrolase n=1 Tax=unclassified Mesorhizobium TaxID=325217 RepID=UPI000FCB56D0|nr:MULTISPECIES: MBL fold metallo-hydrolase [unclassified Mesorhizobium]RUW83405.1 MBL fold metallo-hydrolase [Mesorhizobium sp. M1E.F.Ca.ET.063.01.1.1]RWD95832.1 MAG: MBL fold metallo-hydrolase [Mesorhizobium sp.]TIV54041.1 MAG: MBL fold metallo-hydrolase [Mesorhizobium sp.]